MTEIEAGSKAVENPGKSFTKDINKLGLKAMVVAALVLIMTVPLFFISTIAEERKDRAGTVIGEVTGEWSQREQTLAGPFLVIPIDRSPTVLEGERPRIGPARRYAVILPQELHFQTSAASQMLHRGIYQVPVFTGDIVASGHFPAINRSDIAGPSDNVRWEEAFVSLSLSNLRGVRSSIQLQMNDREQVLEPGQQLAIFGSSGAHIETPGAYGSGDSQTVNMAEDQNFRIEFTLNGSSRLRFVPVGTTTTAAIASDWQSPSFQGAFLPMERTTDETGFTANWAVPNLARSLPDHFVVTDENSTRMAGRMSLATFGVDFIVPLDHYQKIFRALRYAIIFIGFTFLAFFLVETVLKTRLHPVQYLLIGAAQSVFYLMLLSASEHFGFGTAFTLAAAATVSLITAYGSFITRSLKVGTVLFAVLSMIYFVLYSLLQVEDLALLFGSIAIFAALALTMLVTRNVNWYGEEKETPLAEMPVQPSS